MSAIPPPPPLLKPSDSPGTAAANSTKPYSVIVSNSQNVKPKTDTASLASSLQSIASIPAPTIQNTGLGRSTVQPNRAAMAKILEEMILQQPSPKPKVLQWPICPNINDQEYLLYTGNTLALPVPSQIGAVRSTTKHQSYSVREMVF